MYRFFTPFPLTENSPIRLDDEELHHLKKVLRVRPGDEMEIVDGKGTLAHVKYETTISLISLQKTDPPPKKTILIQAIPEKGHLEIIVEKGTELGITEFWFFAAEKSKLTEFSLNLLTRLNKITISALKQSKRLFLPTIRSNVKLTDIQNPPFDLYLADPKGGAFKATQNSSGIIIGPESGLTKREIDFFLNSAKAVPVTLSKNILRAETAAICASFLICQPISF